MELGATPRLAERAVSSLVSRAADPRVVERAPDGDRDAFSLLFRQTVDAVGRYVVTILGDSDAAEDVVSETFLDAWRQLPRCAGRIASRPGCFASPATARSTRCAGARRLPWRTRI